MTQVQLWQLSRREWFTPKVPLKCAVVSLLDQSVFFFTSNMKTMHARKFLTRPFWAHIHACPNLPIGMTSVLRNSIFRVLNVFHLLCYIMANKKYRRMDMDFWKCTGVGTVVRNIVPILGFRNSKESLRW